HVHFSGFVELDLLSFAGTSLSKRVDAEVEGDAVEPGVEAGVALEVIQVFVDFCKGLLADVHGFLSVLHHPQSERVHPALVALHEQPECALITAAYPPDESEIVCSQGVRSTLPVIEAQSSTERATCFELAKARAPKYRAYGFRLWLGGSDLEESHEKS